MIWTEGETMRSWTWIGRYALVLLAAVLLGAAIGELPVFKQTTLGTPKLPAAALARFLGYGGALVIFALLGQRAAGQLRRSGNDTAHLAFLLLPLTARAPAFPDKKLRVLRRRPERACEVLRRVREGGHGVVARNPQRFAEEGARRRSAFGLRQGFQTLFASPPVLSFPDLF
jgi:hypothetical protein